MKLPEREKQAAPNPMTTANGIRVERFGAVSTITLDRPDSKNAIALAMWPTLTGHFDSLAADPATSVVVLTGAGDAFCSGADTRDPAYVADNSPGAVAQRMRTINATAIALHRLPKPTIAAVNGVACGAGWSLALGCDIVLAAESARFSALFVKRGISVDLGGTWLLAHQLGAQQAKHLAFTADFISSRQAQALGLVLEVYDDSVLAGAVAGYANRLCQQPAEALAQIKLGINDALDTTFEQSAEREAHAQAFCAASRIRHS
jgi:enoyl-CoA hydratase/carnithine racemase